MATQKRQMYADYFKYENDTGWITFSERGLYRLKLPKNNQPQPPKTKMKKHALAKTLEDYFKGKRVHFNAKIDFSKYSDFEKIVLNKCLLIGYGNKSSYKELAAAAGNKKASRAVGNALGKNRLPVIIPCHRVVKSDGSLGGFQTGLKYKKQLLELEKNGPKK